MYNQVRKHQHGFLKGKSWTINLIETLDRIGRLLFAFNIVEFKAKSYDFPEPSLDAKRIIFNGLF